MQTPNLLRDLGEIWCLDLTKSGRFIGPVSQGAEAADARNPRLPQVRGSIAVLELYGIITQKPTWWGTSTEEFGRAYGAAMSRDSIGGVVIRVDSPGGGVYGVDELAAKIRGYRGTKPSVAVTDSLNASAAYYLSSAADQVVSTPGGDTGSIGVWTAHENWQAALEMMGIDVTLVSTPRFKVEGHPFGPLDEEAKAEMQRGVDEWYGRFVASVAKSRGLSASKIRSDFGEGRTLSAKDALAAGMIDRVATFEEVLAGMHGKRVSSPSAATLAQDAADTEWLCEVWSGRPCGLVTAADGGDPDLMKRRLSLKQKEAA